MHYIPLYHLFSWLPLLPPLMMTLLQKRIPLKMIPMNKMHKEGIIWKNSTQSSGES